MWPGEKEFPTFLTVDKSDRQMLESAYIDEARDKESPEFNRKANSTFESIMKVTLNLGSEFI